MTPEERIAAGVPLEDALRAFRDTVNKPGTIFSTDHWLSPKLQRLRGLLNDPITADQVEALLDVLYRRALSTTLDESSDELAGSSADGVERVLRIPGSSAA
jgi:hypothetical protein